MAEQTDPNASANPQPTDPYGMPNGPDPANAPTADPNTPAAEQPAEPQMPDWLKNAEGLTDQQRQNLYNKFGDDPAALAKSYAHLESQTGKPKDPNDVSLQPGESGSETDDQNQQTDPNAVPNAAVDKVLEQANLDRDTLYQEYQNNNGELTEETYKKLEEQGWGREAVKDRMQVEVQAHQAHVEKIKSAATEAAGGEEQLGTLLEWGKQNLTEAEMQWYNQQTGDPNSARMAIEWLNTRYNQANGAPPSSGHVEGGGAAPSVTPFSTSQEMSAAMADPRYAPSRNGKPNPQHDPTYYQQVQQRLAKTNLPQWPG